MSTHAGFLRLGLVAIVASVGAGCFVGRAWVVDYTFETAALRDASGRQTALSTSRDGNDVDLIATDEGAEFAFRVEPGRIEVSIRNRGAQALSLELADASFLDGSGQTHRLAVIDPDLAGRGSLEVQPGSTARVFLWPADWVRDGADGRPAVWTGDSPLGGSTIDESSREEALARRQQDIGKSVEVTLPVRRADARTSYRFRFAVSELVARKTDWT